MTSDLGNDIKQAYDELGVPFSIWDLDDGTLSDGGKLWFERSTQLTKPFIVELFAIARFNYITSVQEGNIIKFNNEYWLLTSKEPDFFEGVPYMFNSVIYKCNILGGLYRFPTTNTRGSDYEITSTPAFVKTIRGTLYGTAQGGSAPIEMPYGEVLSVKQEAYFPKDFGIQDQDRLVLTTGEVYKIENVFMSNFENIISCRITGDER